ncbi:hypothetical protein ACS4RR_000500 [Rhizobium sp. Z1P35]|uniref:hypothetical protein n=1 Tax=Rhizobium sp. SRDI969 TaxID=3138252 RepID=UPI0021A55B84|nr:hypothetical protein [Rhizobium leguminosarum]UWM81737.1 hypothetical protein N2A41_00180 [Rhizobium leguminosarum bv. viciae]
MNLLIVAGGVGLAVSVLWWHTFYSHVAQFLGATGPLPMECIYTMGGPCGMVAGVANAVGASAYDPKLFWGSAALLVIGAITRLLPDGSERRDYQTKETPRKEPRP